MARPCPFCSLSGERIVAEDELTITVRDICPVSPGHTLVIARRHVSSLFDLTADEAAALFRAVSRARLELDGEHRPDGYNVGVNVGAAAGQSIWHVHVHVIPRYSGDTRSPRGGVRHSIPGRGHHEIDGD